jgi:hypothetical protein
LLGWSKRAGRVALCQRVCLVGREALADRDGPVAGKLVIGALAGSGQERDDLLRTRRQSLKRTDGALHRRESSTKIRRADPDAPRAEQRPIVRNRGRASGHRELLFDLLLGLLVVRLLAGGQLLRRNRFCA